MSAVWWQMAIENSVSNDFLSTLLDSIGIFDCRLPGVILLFFNNEINNHALENLIYSKTCLQQSFKNRQN